MTHPRRPAMPAGSTRHHRLKTALLLAALLLSAPLFLAACGGGGSGGSPSAGGGSLGGHAQKGAFVLGSTANAYALDAAATRSGATASTTTTDNRGSYALSPTWAGWTEVEISGLSFDEYSGNNSAASLTLKAITNLGGGNNRSNANLFTHLVAARTKALVAGGATLAAAHTRAESDLKALMGLASGDANALDLNGGGTATAADNAVLLLFSGGFMAAGGDAARLQHLADGFADDGQLNGGGQADFAAIANAAGGVGFLGRLHNNLVAHGENGAPDSNDLPVMPAWVNEHPTANAASTSTAEGTAKAITLSGTDPEGNSLTFSKVAGPTHGTATISGNTATYTPSANYHGADSFTFRANDGAVDSAAATISIAIIPTSIASVAAACAAEPVRPGGTTHYYCDCGPGAEGGCVPGLDTNAGTDPSAPQRTVENAAARLGYSGTLALGDTIALCKGGAFNATKQLPIGNPRCPAGDTCNDLREYTPTAFAGTAKPIISYAGGFQYLFSLMNGVGGLRLLNLKLQGDGANWGFFFYNGVHDVTLCNLEMDSFAMAANNAGNPPTAVMNTNIRLTGSRITNSQAFGYLGAGRDTDISYNYWDGNGSSNKFDHTVYVGSGPEQPVNVRIVGNYIHGQYGPTCKGVAIVGHGMFDGLTVADNTIDIDPAATTGGCYGIAFGNGGTTNPAYLRHAVFSGNTIRNGGSISLMVSNCPDCVIENNLVIQDWSLEGYPYPTTGIVAPAEAARAGMDDVSDRNLIRNNTIWFGPRHTHGALGVSVGTEGTGHVVANNTVYYSSPSTVDTWGGVNCFGYPLAPPSYASINNNHCHSNAPYKWEATHGALAAWQSYSGSDTASITGDPLFTQAGTAFTPLPGSPLVGAGSAADGAVYDLSGKVRPNPPSIGAYEP